MKKVFSLVIALLTPFMLFSQILDSATIFYETFEGSTVDVTSTGSLRWSLNSSYYKSPTHSFHSPVYTQSGNSMATTNAIPLSSPLIDDEVRHVYLEFDHICKVNSLDNATIYYAVATGMDQEGNYNWDSYRLLNFSKASPFYYGDGLADPYATRGTGHFGAYSSGKFNDAC